MNTEEIHATFETVRVKALTEWGAMRRFISANPLTGFWIGVVLGGAVGTFITWILP